MPHQQRTMCTACLGVIDLEVDALEIFNKQVAKAGKKEVTRQQGTFEQNPC